MNRWTSKMDDVLRQQVAAAVPLRAIAAQLARAFPDSAFTRHSVGGRALRLGLVHPDARTFGKRLRPQAGRSVTPQVAKSRGFSMPRYGGPTTASPVEKMMESARANAAARGGYVDSPLFAPLAATTPRPWTTRRFGECAWPVGEQGGAEMLSCCEPVADRGWCERHLRIGCVPTSVRRRVDDRLDIPRRAA
jgi:hypothetical protein